MFTGIIEELGEVKNLSRRGKITLLEVESRIASDDIKLGESVSVNGACLTVTDKKENSIYFEVMPETLTLTNIGSLKIKEKINLERALKLGDRVSGHFVTGHIDCAGIIRRTYYQEDNLCFEIAVPVSFMKYVLPKGSISVDGISLTVAKKGSDTFSVYIIPHTFKNTTLSFRHPSDKVNIEFDILAKKQA